MSGFSLGEKQEACQADYFIFLRGWRVPVWQTYWYGSDGKIPDGWVKTTFLRETKATVRLGIKPV